MLLKFRVLFSFFTMLFLFSCSSKQEKSEALPRNLSQVVENSLRNSQVWTDSNQQIPSNQNISTLYSNGIKACRVGSIRNALRLGDLCFELAQKSRGDSDFTLAYHLMGKGSSLSKNYEKANERFTKAVEFAQKSKFDLVLPYIFSDLAELQIHLQKPGIGLDLLKKVEVSPEFQKSLPLKLAYHELRSTAYSQLNQFNLAQKEAQTHLELAKNSQDLNWISQSKNQLCAVEIKRGNWVEANRWHDESAQLIQNLKDFRVKEETYVLGLQLAKAQNDVPKILANQEKLLALKDQLIIEERTGHQEAFFKSLQWGAVEQERTQMIELTERNRLLMIIGGLILAFVSTSLILSHRLSRKMKLANLKLTAKNREIHRKNEEIEKKSEELNRLNRVLEGKIQERTQKLIHQNNKLREVAYYNSHRVRGPLSTIMGLVDLYQGKMMDDVQLLMNEIDNHSRELDRNLFEINEVLKKEDPSSN